MAYSPEEKENILNTIFKDIEGGVSTRQAVKDAKISSSTFWGWIDDDEVKAKQYESCKTSESYLTRIKCKSNPKGSRAIGLNDYRKSNARKANIKRFGNKPNCIYILKVKNETIYKIGVSQNIDRRIRDIQSANYKEIELFVSRKIDNAYEIEEQIHIKFEESHIKSEWFNLSDDDLNKVINIIIQ